MNKIAQTRRQTSKYNEVQLSMEEQHKIKMDARKREDIVLNQNKEFIEKARHDHKHYIEAIGT